MWVLASVFSLDTGFAFDQVPWYGWVPLALGIAVVARALTGLSMRTARRALKEGAPVQALRWIEGLLGVTLGLTGIATLTQDGRLGYPALVATLLLLVIGGRIAKPYLRR